MAQLSFGTILRETREKKGLDLTGVARRLRIRPDILEAIEDANFTRMPPRGYTRNMVNAYAHFLGLNSTDVTRMYLDECYAYQVGRTRAQETRRGGRTVDMSAAPARGKSATRGQLRDNGSGRRQYSDDYPTEATSQMQRLYSEENTHRTKRTAMSDNHYTNFYSGPKAPSALTHSKTPFIVAAVVILLLVILICVLLFMPKGESATNDTPVVPVSGLSDSNAKTNEEQKPEAQPEAKPAAVAPTKFTFSYEVAAQNKNYLEVVVDGSTVEADTIAGPAKKSFDSAGEIKFTTVDPATVKAFVDGAAVTPTDDDGNGVYSITIKFSDILAQWQKDNPTATPAANTAAPASNASNTSAAPTNAAASNTVASTGQ